MNIRIALPSLLLLVSCLVADSVLGQSTYNVHLDSVQAGFRGTGNSVREVAGGVLVFGWQYSADPVGAVHVFTRMLDEQGRVVQQQEYEPGDSGYYARGGVDPMADLDDGTFVAAVAEGWSVGDSSWLYRFNADGERIGRQFIMTFPVEDSLYHYFNDVAPLSDGGFVLCGTIGSPTGTAPARALLVKLASSGDVAWWQSYVHARALGAVRELPDGGFAAAGYRSNAPDRSVLMRTSPSGAIHWIRYTGAQGDGASIVRVDDDGAVITWSNSRTSNMDWYYQAQVLTKRSNAGDLIWEWSSAPGYGSSATDFEVLPDGGFVTVGTRGGRGIITRHDAEGLQVWSRDYRLLNGQHYFTDVERTMDGGFLMTGGAWRYVPLDPGIQTHELTWVVKTDSLGCVVPGCHTVGVQEYALDLNEHLQLAPNPVARGQALRIRFEPPQTFTPQGPLRVVVLDATGRMVHEEVMRGTTLNLTNLQPSTGLYYLHLTDGTRWLAGGKLVVE